MEDGKENTINTYREEENGKREGCVCDMARVEIYRDRKGRISILGREMRLILLVL